MTTNQIWMVRAGKNAANVDDFIDGNFVGIGFQSAGDVSVPVDRETLEQAIAQTHPSFNPGKIGRVASQVKRFYEELNIGDAVMTYDSSQRLSGRILQSRSLIFRSCGRWCSSTIQNFPRQGFRLPLKQIYSLICFSGK
ncbi:MAG: hypothetical protein AAF958_16445 [Planctomycetota bacterium]